MSNIHGVSSRGKPWPAILSASLHACKVIAAMVLIPSLGFTVRNLNGFSASRSEAGRNVAIPETPGWFEIPNTQLASSCPDIPDIHGVEGCGAVIADWGGGLADTKRNRLVIWGGGHNGYFGNELYALDLNQLVLQRITNPSSGNALSNLGSCPEAYADGSPNARHSYNGLQYVSKLDSYYALGAGLSPCGFFTNFSWMFNPVSMTWTRQNPKNHPNPAQNGSVPLTSYDAVSGTIYEVEANTGQFWQYDAAADSWSSLGTVSACSRLNMTSAIDPGRRLYFCIGNNSFSSIRLTGSHTAKTLMGSGCSDLRSAGGPGFDFDGSQNRMVGWAGGNTIYVYNPDTDSCSIQTYDDGPGHPQANGTYGRFRYFPALGVFALVNDWKQNSYTLRLKENSIH